MPGPKLIPIDLLGSLVLENASDFAVVTADFDGLITGWSPGARRVFGYSDEEALGMNMAVLFTASDLAAGADREELEAVQREGHAEDSRWHIRKGGERFWANGVSVRIDRPPVQGLLKIVRDETPQKRAEEQRVLLLHELNHRINNTLATVQSIAEQTLRAGDVEASTRESLSKRLIALSEAHNVLVQENWAGADLETIVRKALSPHDQPTRARFALDGPPVRLDARQSLAVAMVVHELATNALKYGALTAPSGQVEVTWNQLVDAQGMRHMTFLWREHGGPPVAKPQRIGFGTRLIERSFNPQNGGRARLRYEPDGLRCTIELKLSHPDEAPAMDLERAKNGRLGD